LKRIVDISLPIEETTPAQDKTRYTQGPRTYYKPGELYVKISKVADYSSEKKERMTSRLDAPLHTATHIDAPLHRVEDGKAINDIPLETFMGKMIIVDFSSKALDLVIDEKKLASKVGRKRPKRLLIRTGWFNKLGTPAYYGSRSPRLTLGAVQWIISKGIILLATDFIPDSTRDRNLPLQKELLSNGVCILANLTNLDQIHGNEFHILALPLKLPGMEASMCRAIATMTD
jgi:arylformamidase